MDKLSELTSVIYREQRGDYPTAVCSKGMYITDSQGKHYLDMSGGAAVSSVGHNHPLVNQAIIEQLGQLAFAHTAFFTHQPQEILAKLITEQYTEPRAKVYFSSGGSEANETAFKLAWQYWQARGKLNKKIIISREMSYHGNTLGALSVSGNAGRRQRSAAPLLDWPRISPCYPLRNQQDSETENNYGLRMAEELKTAIEAVGEDRVAAFICEPIVGSSLGVVAATAGYFKRIRDICDQYNILLICDEIMCGSGRTGSYFAHQQEGIVADITTLAKGIAGGYQPLAATVIRKSLIDVIERAGFAHGHTYISHPLACVAGIAVQQVIEQENLLVNCQQMGKRLMNELQSAFSDHQSVAQVRGRGLFIGLELVADRNTLSGFSGSGQDARLRQLAMRHGLICYPSAIQVEGKTVPHIMLAPPLNIAEKHIDECVSKLMATIDEFVCQ